MAACFWYNINIAITFEPFVFLDLYFYLTLIDHLVLNRSVRPDTKICCQTVLFGSGVYLKMKFSDKQESIVVDRTRVQTLLCILTDVVRRNKPQDMYKQVLFVCFRTLPTSPACRSQHQSIRWLDRVVVVTSKDLADKHALNCLCNKLCK